MNPFDALQSQLDKLKDVIRGGSTPSRSSSAPGYPPLSGGNSQSYATINITAQVVNLHTGTLATAGAVAAAGAANAGAGGLVATGSGGGGAVAAGQFDWHQMQQVFGWNMTPTSMISGALSAIPAGPATMGFMAAYMVAGMATDSFVGQRKADISYHLGIDLARLSGAGVPEYNMGSMRELRQMEKAYAYNDAYFGWMKPIPGMGIGPRIFDAEQQAEMERARGVIASTDLAHAGLSLGGPWEIGDPNNQIKFAFAQAQGGFMSMSGGALLDDPRFEAVRQKFGNQGGSGLMGAVGQIEAQLKGNRKFRHLQADAVSGKTSREMLPDMISALVDEGDFLSLGKMLKSYTGQEDAQNLIQQAIDPARQKGLAMGDVAIAGYQTSKAGSEVTRLRGIGASGSTIAAGILATQQPLGEEIGALDRAIALTHNTEDLAQLNALKAEKIAQKDSAPQAASMTLIGAASLTQQGVSLSAQVGLQSARLGGDLDLGYRRAGEAARSGSHFYKWSAEQPGVPPEQASVWRAMAEQEELQANKLLPRTKSEDEFRNLYAIGSREIAGAGADLAKARFGPPSGYRDAFEHQANAIHSQEQAVTRRLSQGNFMPGEENTLRAQLNDLIRQETEARQHSITVVNELNVTIAQTRMSTAFAGGVGGTAGIPFTRAAIGAAQTAVDDLVKAGVPENNQAMVNARAQLTQAELSQARVPFSAASQERKENALWRVSILSQLPGTFGSTKGEILGGLREIDSQVHDIDRQERDAIADNPAMRDQLHLEFQRRRRALGSEQVGLYQQLAYGWESRLISQAINTPGTYAFAAPHLAYRAAVGAGVYNPHMGNNEGLPFFLREGVGRMHTIAGSTGTPEGYGVSALTGVPGVHGFGMPTVMPSPAAKVEVKIEVKNDSNNTLRTTIDGKSADTSGPGLSQFFTSIGQGGRGQR